MQMSLGLLDMIDTALLNLDFRAPLPTRRWSGNIRAQRRAGEKADASPGMKKATFARRINALFWRFKHVKSIGAQH